MSVCLMKSSEFWITDSYDERIQEMKSQLSATLPKICKYFGRDDFMKIATKLESYDRNVKKHYGEFLETQKAWEKIIEYFAIVSHN